MAPPEKLRIRNGLEAELTKDIKKLKRRVKEKSNATAIRAQIEVCAQSYDKLEEAHYAWVEYLHEDKPDEETAKSHLQLVAKWLADKEAEYDQAISAATEVAGAASPPEPVAASPSPTPLGATPGASSGGNFMSWSQQMSCWNLLDR